MIERLHGWLASWWSSLRIYANPELRRILTTPSAGDFGPVPRPTGMPYRVDVTREDGWLMVCVPELDVLTQARNWDEVELMARALIAITLDVDPAMVALDIRGGTG